MPFSGNSLTYVGGGRGWTRNSALSEVLRSGPVVGIQMSGAQLFSGSVLEALFQVLATK